MKKWCLFSPKVTVDYFHREKNNKLLLYLSTYLKFEALEHICCTLLGTMDGFTRKKVCKVVNVNLNKVLIVCRPKSPLKIAFSKLMDVPMRPLPQSKGLIV